MNESLLNDRLSRNSSNSDILSSKKRGFFFFLYVFVSRIWSAFSSIFGNFNVKKQTLKVGNRDLRIIRKIGEGGFAYVWLVYDFISKEEYALKNIMCQTKEQYVAATRELDVLKSLDHPNILKVIDSDVVPLQRTHNPPSESDQELYRDVRILSLYYPLGTIDEILTARWDPENGCFTEEKILLIFKGICQGLLSMHSHKPLALAHHDLKTHNILLSNDYTPILMDLGSASPARVKIESRQQAVSLQEWASTNCSMAFRAPELHDPSSSCVITEKTDIWSLGCVLYALCYRMSPFEKVYQEGGSIALASVSGKYTIPQLPRYSSHLQTLVHTLLQPNPDDRPWISEVIKKVDNVMDKLNTENDINITME